MAPLLAICVEFVLANLARAKPETLGPHHQGAPHDQRAKAIPDPPHQRHMSSRPKWDGPGQHQVLGATLDEDDGVILAADVVA
jgi:hypothetical protein